MENESSLLWSYLSVFFLGIATGILLAVIYLTAGGLL